MPDQPSPQPLDYASPGGRKRSWLPIVLIVAAIAAAAVIVVSAFLPSIGSHSSSPRARCASNMHQIGLAILLYQNDHNQVYPNSLDELLEEQITPAVFICPDSNDTASAGATTQAVAADWAKPGYLSYIYLGKGLTDKTATPDTVVLYEPLTNHGGAGMNVLFGDGHAEWINATVGAKLVAAAATGRLPITLDPTTGAVATSQPAR